MDICTPPCAYEFTSSLYWTNILKRQIPSWPTTAGYQQAAAPAATRLLNRNNLQNVFWNMVHQIRNLPVRQLPTRVGHELRMGRVESIAYILRQKPWKKPLCLGTGCRPLGVGSRQWVDFDDHRDALHWTCCRCLEDACAFSVPLHDFPN